MAQHTLILSAVLSLIAVVDPERVVSPEAPWFVRLNFCEQAADLKGGGVLVGEGNWVLTAGHVVEIDPPNRAYWETYDSGDLASPAQVTKICLHPDFRQPPADGTENVFIPNDLALIRIDRSGRTLALAQSAPQIGSPGMIYGWGRTEDGQESNSGTLNKNSREVKVLRVEGRTFDATSMACTGDSGAPFVEGDRLVGIYKGDDMIGECSPALDFYTAVAPYRDWIQSVMTTGGPCAEASPPVPGCPG